MEILDFFSFDFFLNRLFSSDIVDSILVDLNLEKNREITCVSKIRPYARMIAK